MSSNTISIELTDDAVEIIIEELASKLSTRDWMYNELDRKYSEVIIDRDNAVNETKKLREQLAQLAAKKKQEEEDDF